MKLKKLVNVLCSNDNDIDNQIAFVLNWDDPDGQECFEDVDIEYISQNRNREILVWFLEWNKDKERLECLFSLK